jgi:hypothetical protein
LRHALTVRAREGWACFGEIGEAALKEGGMCGRERCLRGLVEKWLGSASRDCIRVTQFGHTRHRPWRYVRIEATHTSNPYAFVFFRHDDGSWCVFPPDDAGMPTLRSERTVKALYAP